MRFSCTKETLSRTVSTIQRAISTKPSLPILSGVHLTAADNVLAARATDYELGIKFTALAEIAEPGTVLVSGRHFIDIVRRLPDTLVNIYTAEENRTMVIEAGQSRFSLLTMPADEYPALPNITFDNPVVIDDKTLLDLIKKTAFSCSTDEGRPIFTGALFECLGDVLRMVATNTHRLAIYECQIKTPAPEAKLIIPAKALNELNRLLAADAAADVSIGWQKSYVAFSFGDYYITSRLIEGQFPDWRRVIPASFSTTVTLAKQPFLAAVERVSLITRDSEYSPVRFSFKEDCVTLTANNPDVGQATDIAPVISIDGSPLEIAFNSHYVIDILRIIESEQFTFSLTTATTAAVIQPLDDPSYTYVMTPLRTA